METFNKIEWSNEFELGNSLINDEHKGLVELYNKLEAAVKDNIDDNQLTSVLTELTNYSLKHFRDEEEWMQKIKYPEFELHQREHKDFIYRIAMFNLSFNSLDKKMVYEITSFLREWIINHLMVSDKKIEAYRIRLQ